MTAKRRGPTTLRRWLSREIRLAEKRAWDVDRDGSFNPKFENHYALGRAHALKEVRVKLVPVRPRKAKR